MSSSPRTPPTGGAFSRRFTAYDGLFFDDFDPNSAWLRERGSVRLPPFLDSKSLIIRGAALAHLWVK